MSAPHRRSSAVWIVLALVFLLVAYAASIGPVAWGVMWWQEFNGLGIDGIETAFTSFYLPLFLAIDMGPEWLESFFTDYLNWGIPEASGV